MIKMNTTRVGYLSALLMATLLVACGEDPAAVIEDDSRTIRVQGEGAQDNTEAEALPTLGDTPINDNPNDAPDGTPSDLGNEESEERIAGLGGGAEAGLTCNEIYTCFNECANREQSCMDACYNSGTSRAQAAVQAISECLQANECQDEPCVQQNCANQIATCDAQDEPANTGSPSAPGDQGNSGNSGAPGFPGNGGGVGGGNRGGNAGGGVGDLVCNDIFACYAACGQGDQNCISQCYDRGTASGRRAIDGVGACIDANQCQDSACVTENCTNQVRICDNDDGVERLSQPNGRDLTCNEIERCFGSCAPDDERCNDTCYNSGSPDARQALSSIGACIRSFNCQTEACIQNNCADQVNACANNQPSAAPANPGGGAGGNGQQLSCNGIIECFRTCDQDNRECLDACYNRGNPDGQQAMSALGTCSTQHECQHQACLEANCAPQVQACNAQDNAAPQQPAPPQPGGQGAGLECVGIYQCSNGCQGDENCRRDCFQRGTGQGQAEATAVSNCVQQNGCRDDACAQASCAQEIQACEAPDAGGQEQEQEPPLGQAPHNAPDNQQPQGDSDGTCQGPDPLQFGQTAGTTSGAARAESGTCGGGGGSEMVYSFTVDQATQVCLNTAGSRIDTVLYVRSNNCNDARSEVICNDDMFGVQSQLSLMANPGTTYYVVVDSYNAGGEFLLNFQPGACQ